jgi:hypothetical protein
MALYLVTYDLKVPGQDYPALTQALNSMAAKRILLSTWLLRRENTTTTELRDYFWKVMDANDRLLVMEWAGQAAWMRPMFDPMKV